MTIDALRVAIADRQVSRWVWVLLAFGITYALLMLIQTRTMDPFSVAGMAFSIAGVLVAAALMYVAPRSRLIQLAAIGFVAPVVVRAVELLLAGEPLLWPGTPSNSYLAFAQGVRDVADAIRDVGFVFQLLAVLALAAYVGRIRTRTSWLIVAFSALLAAASALWIASTSPAAEFFPAHRGALSMVAQVTLVAWGYLLALAIEKRRVLLSAAAATTLINPALTLLIVTLFGDALTAGPGELVMLIFSAASWLLLVVHWLALLGGVLLELRPDRHIASTPSPEWQPDPSGLRP